MPLVPDRRQLRGPIGDRPRGRGMDRDIGSHLPEDVTALLLPRPQDDVETVESCLAASIVPYRLNRHPPKLQTCGHGPVGRDEAVRVMQVVSNCLCDGVGPATVKETNMGNDCKELCGTTQCKYHSTESLRTGSDVGPGGGERIETRLPSDLRE